MPDPDAPLIFLRAAAPAAADLVAVVAGVPVAVVPLDAVQLANHGAQAAALLAEHLHAVRHGLK